MPIKILSVASLAAVVGFTGYVPPVQAIGFGDMMNPSRWMGGGNNRDRNDDYGDYGDYGGPWGGGPYGGGPYGGGPYGGGPYGGGPYGGGPYGGYGAPGYGAPGIGVPGYMGAPMAAPAAPAAPAQSGSSSQAEIDTLKRRIDELEAGKQQSQPAPAADWPSAPAFRPMNQY